MSPVIAAEYCFLPWRFRKQTMWRAFYYRGEGRFRRFMKMASAGVETNLLYKIYSKLVIYFIVFLL